MKPRRDSLESSIHFSGGRSSSTFMEMSKPKKNGDGHFRKRRRGESQKKWERSKQSVEHVMFSTGLIFVVGGICYCLWWQILQGVQHIYLKRNPVGPHYRKEVNVLEGIPLNSGLVQVCSVSVHVSILHISATVGERNAAAVYR